ncbi:TRAP transporter fused permease subunit [Alginatibacterium sediminis]|uniref:TRAP transporter fused permease subunit n=1 Tax=Alginatibacterium sediminis TaxID=2164068 RepID=A0A420ECY2_9ALTE|nr:TRAP transporter permease [Alginatibacterium sediminis]RKF18525.1 TRAP transporter fused permease subunit [Alginatibacterium sediminis]
MSLDNSKATQLNEEELQDLVASIDTGGRNPDSQKVVKLMAVVALSWAIFQIWIASPLPYVIGWGVFASGEARSIHLGFAIFLGFLSYPASKNSPRNFVPSADWALAVVGALCALYPLIADSNLVDTMFGTRLSNRPSAPNSFDILVSITGMLMLLEATRRALGPPLMVVAIVFLSYTFLGPHAPELIAWKGSTFGGVMDHQWLFSEGVFGIALGVSTDLVFLFVLFGALLDRAGAGNYFIKVAFSLMGHFRGGPAKAAVVASGMTGLISGSSIANVVTTGTFTIPMMKRVGFSAEKAGAIEVASSVNGQIMPPVMGAAAFLMVEYVNIPYFEVVKHAFLPAVISYIALVYIVHLEAMKSNMQGLERADDGKTAKSVLLSWAMTLLPIVALAGGSFYLAQLYEMLAGPAARLGVVLAVIAIQYAVVKGLKAKASEETVAKAISTGAIVLGNTVIGAFGLFFLFSSLKSFISPDMMFWVVSALVLIVYVLLARISSRYPDLVMDDPDSPVQVLPETGPTVKSGLHFLLPVVVLIWCLMIERKSPGLSAFYATILMIFILLTQRFLFDFFRKKGTAGSIKRGFDELIDGLIAGSRNMIGIAIATAAAGIIVGTVSQTGVGLKLAALVEFLSMGHIMLILLWTGILSLILGMGLPTTANYIVVSSLLAPVIVSLGQQNGLIVPLIAVHMFVFYFGIMADVTPPVGLASFAAAAISGADPIKTGFVAFFYSLRTALLPFLFIFNTDLLLMDVSFLEGILVFVVATAAMLIFTAGTQGYFISKSKVWESFLLMLVAFTLFRPGFWMDYVVPPYEERTGSQLVQAMADVEPGTQLRILVDGQTEVGDPVKLTMLMEVAEGETGEDRIMNYGLELLAQDNGSVMIDGIGFDSAAEKAGFDFDQVIDTVGVPVNRPARQWFYVPALILLGFIILRQRRRRDNENSNMPNNSQQVEA